MSPVREYRIPGSVRGPLGNRQSYLNGIKMSRIIPFAVLLAAFLASCRSSSDAVTRGFDGKPMNTIDLSAETKSRRRNFEHAESLGPVSLLQVVANPERFHGKRIVVEGYAILKFEVQGIFPSPDPSITPKNGVWLDYDFGTLPNDPEAAILQPVLIEGVFDAKGGGHMVFGRASSAA